MLVLVILFLDRKKGGGSIDKCPLPLELDEGAAVQVGKCLEVCSRQRLDSRLKKYPEETNYLLSDHVSQGSFWLLFS